jgi:hypothetical protein
VPCFQATFKVLGRHEFDFFPRVCAWRPGPRLDSSSLPRYEVLGVHEFDSTRKRMSVVVRCPDESIRLLVKGADSALVPLLGPLYTSKGPVHSRRPSWDGHQVGTTNRGTPSSHRQSARRLMVSAYVQSSKIPNCLSECLKASGVQLFSQSVTLAKVRWAYSAPKLGAMLHADGRTPYSLCRTQTWHVRWNLIHPGSKRSPTPIAP